MSQVLGDRLYGRAVVFGLSSLVASLLAAPVRADPLVGDVGAAYSTPEAAEDNPANAAFLEQTQFFYAAEAYKNETFNARYPGFDQTQMANSGLATPLAKPAFIWKATPRLGVGGFYIPTLPFTINIHTTKIPTILIGSQYYVDMNVAAKLNGLGEAMLGYRVSDHLAIGIGIDFLSLSFNATLTPSGGTNPLATVTGSQTTADLILGVRADLVPGRFSLGAAVTVASEQNMAMQVNSPLIGGGSAGGAAQTDGTNGAGSIRPFTGALLGFQVAPISGLRLMAEGRYTHVNTSQTGYSLVALKQEPQDVHDTLALRSGLILSLGNGFNLLGGFRYEPASLGEGSRGDQGEIGFGTINVVQILAGLSPMTPYYMLAGGVQIGLVPKYPARDDGRGRPRDGQQQHRHDPVGRPYYQLVLEGGIAYTYASLGIDSSGELPGAYLYRKISVPLGVGYKF